MTANKLREDPRQVPIPPLSVVRFARIHGEKRNSRRDKGRVFRIGYYSLEDGLDCIWLVNDEGKYEQTTDHEYLYKYFDVIQFAEHTNWYGHKRPEIPSVRRAEGRSKKRK